MAYNNPYQYKLDVLCVFQKKYNKAPKNPF